MVEVHRARAAIVAPRARDVATRRTTLATTAKNPYHWLRDPDYPQLNDSEILEHIAAENFHAHATIAKPLRDLLKAKLQARVQPRDATIPHRSRNYSYWWRFEPRAPTTLC